MRGEASLVVYQSEEIQVWVLTGPTASGKSGLGLDLAQRHDLEIVSADSMSVYKRMDIGTAKPTAEDRAKVPHHGLDLVEPWEDFDSSRYVQEADSAIASILERGRRPLILGGTPLYLMALLRGFFEGPSKDVDLRRRLGQEEDRSPGLLHERLQGIDPEAAGRIHRNDRKRLIRALEVFELTGQPISALQTQFEQGPPRYLYRALALQRSRDELRDRVRLRCQAMFELGLVEEVREILSAGGFGSSAGAAIGYREVVDFLEGRLDAEELQYRVRSNTHRLVRRQSTWFRGFPDLLAMDVVGGLREEDIATAEDLLDLHRKET